MSNKTVKDMFIEYLQQNCKKESEASKSRKGAEWMVKNYPEWAKNKKDKSKRINSDVALITQIASEISSRIPNWKKKYPEIKTTDNNKYYFTESTKNLETGGGNQKTGPTTDSETEDKSSPPSSKSELREEDLYPMLPEFLVKKLNVYSMRINEKISKKSKKDHNRWLHPDLVGIEDISENWVSEINKHFLGEFPDKKCKLWSFEVKIELTPSSVREDFFQTVSNSSWANFGYLVANEITKSKSFDTLKELRMLSGLHGIGVIKLNTENPLKSEIIIPARERLQIDWDTANKLAIVNSDFKEFIELINDFYKSTKYKKLNNYWKKDT